MRSNIEIENLQGNKILIPVDNIGYIEDLKLDSLGQCRRIWLKAPEGYYHTTKFTMGNIEFLIDDAKGLYKKV